MLSKHRPTTLRGLWTAVQEDCAKIPLRKIQKALLSLKLRYRKAAQNKGYPNKYLKYKYFM